MADKNSSVCIRSGSPVKEDVPNSEHESMDLSSSILERHTSCEESLLGQSSKSPSPDQSKDVCWETSKTSEEISCYKKPPLPQDVAEEKEGGTDLAGRNRPMEMKSDLENNSQPDITPAESGSVESGKRTMHTRVKTKIGDSVMHEPPALTEYNTCKKAEEMSDQDKYFEEVFGDLEDIITLPKIRTDTLFHQPWQRYGSSGASSGGKRGASSGPSDSGNLKRPKTE